MSIISEVLSLLLFFCVSCLVHWIISRKSSINSRGSSSSTTTTTMASAERKGPYDVFLSFRGKDTRKGFVSYLYKDLVEKGIHTFRDDSRLEWGKPIAPELLKAIDESKIAIVVLSKNYADSPCCLDELVHILENYDMIVFPVFYDVKVSDVRHQRNAVAKALFRALFAYNLRRYWHKALALACFWWDVPSEHGSISADKSRRWKEALTKLATKFIDKPEIINESNIKSTRWKQGLTKAAYLSGLDVPNTANGDEAECIKLIVAAVFHKLSDMMPNAQKDLVGIRWRADKVMAMLRLEEAKTVRIVGISGMGGAGKTTLAAHIFHNLSISFGASCFLQINGGNSSNLKDLQKALLSKILNFDSIDISDIGQGMNMIKCKCQSVRILVVIDNVEDEHQLDALALEHGTFGKGSRIIITTRNSHLLLDRVNDRYDIELLNEDEEKQLFCWHAFPNRSHPPENLADLCCRVVDYAGGLPLALKVLGSHLRGASFIEWSDALRKLQDVSHKDIYSILKISYDGLDEEEKRIFREIACFFKGEEKREVIEILDSLELHPEIGISILIRKSLLSIEFDRKNKCERLNMHDLIQAMGRDIARTNHPGSLLWKEEEIVDVLTGVGECEQVEEIVLKTFNLNTINDNDEVLARMKKLKLLSLERVDYSRAPQYLPSGLQCLRWNEYPWDSLPSSFLGKKLVGLVMHGGQIVEPIKGELKFERLRIMDLSHCHEITQTPDLSKYPNLEELTMRDCAKLLEVHPSFGVHKKLQHVDLSYCWKLKRLPERLEMESLKCFNLQHCWNLENFPEIKENMIALKELDLSCCTRIRGLHYSIRHFTSLSILHLPSCDIFGIFNIKQIENPGQVITTDSSNLPKLQLENILRDLFPHHLMNENTINDLTRWYSSPDHASPSSPIVTVRAHKIDSQLSRFLFSLVSFPQLELLNVSHCSLSRLAIPKRCFPSLNVLDLCGNPLEELLISEDCLLSLKFLHLTLFVEGDGERQGEVSRLRALFERLQDRDVNLSMVSLVNSIPPPPQFISVQSKNKSTHPKPEYSLPGIKLSLNWEALSRVLCRRDSEMTILLQRTDIPEWFRYRIHGFYEVILPPVRSLYNKSCRGILVCVYCNYGSGVLKFCHQRQRDGYKITAELLIVRYIPLSCSSCNMETTGDRLQKNCWVDAYIEKDSDPPVADVEWGIQLVYEDDVDKINYDDITINRSLFTGEPSTASHLKVFFGETEE